jgi:hypothetical protein
MKFDMLPESEMIQKTKAGNRSYLDLLLSKHEQFLLHHASKIATNPKGLLIFRRDCIEYVHANFHDSFNPLEHADFATWLLECVIPRIDLKKV